MDAGLVVAAYVLGTAFGIWLALWLAPRLSVWPGWTDYDRLRAEINWLTQSHMRLITAVAGLKAENEQLRAQQIAAELMKGTS